MIEERYKRLFDKLHPKEKLLRDTLAAATRPKISRQWTIAAAFTIVLVVAAAFCIALPPRDVVASHGETPQHSDGFVPIETAQRYGCCDVRDIELNILNGWIYNGVLYLDVELLGEALHPEMVLTLRLHDDSSMQAYHLLCTQVEYTRHSEKKIAHRMNCRIEADSIPPEGKRVTFAINNYDCGLDHDRYPHWEEDAAWEDVLPDCLTVDFMVYRDGTIALTND